MIVACSFFPKTERRIRIELFPYISSENNPWTNPRTFIKIFRDFLLLFHQFIIFLPPTTTHPAVVVIVQQFGKQRTEIFLWRQTCLNITNFSDIVSQNVNRYITCGTSCFFSSDLFVYGKRKRIRRLEHFSLHNGFEKPEAAIDASPENLSNNASFSR